MRSFIICTPPKRIIWTEHLARIGAVRNSYVIYVGRPKGGYWFGAVGIGGRILLKCIFMKYGVGWIRVDHVMSSWRSA
jgi:hypothetical protein